MLTLHSYEQEMQIQNGQQSNIGKKSRQKVTKFLLGDYNICSRLFFCQLPFLCYCCFIC